MNPLENLYTRIDTLKPDGSVQLVYDKISQQIFILKRRNLEQRELYLILKKMQSLYLPEIYRLVEFDGYLYVVEEAVNGKTLAEILQYEGAISEKLAVKILLQLCDSLNQLHARKIVHRDLKPSSIMLTREHRIKLIDLGISRIYKKSVESDTKNLGTKGYAPPEQFGFGQTDSRSDIYALGITMQQMLGENYRGYLSKILARCVEFDPAHRYQSAKELSYDVEHGLWRHRIKKFFSGATFIFITTIFALNIPKTVIIEVPVEKSAVEKIPREEIENQIDDQIENQIEIPKIEENLEIEEKSPTIEELKSIYKVEPVTFEEKKFDEQSQIPNQLPNQNQNSQVQNPNQNSQSQIQHPTRNSDPNPKPKSDPRLKHYCRMLLNGQPFKTEIPSSVWNSWQRDGDSRLIPNDYVVSLIVENRDSSPLKDLIVEIDGEYIDKKTIAPNSSAQFDFKIGNQQIYRSKNFSVRLICDDENFSWSGGSFGKYKEFQIYLMK